MISILVNLSSPSRQSFSGLIRSIFDISYSYVHTYEYQERIRVTLRPTIMGKIRRALRAVFFFCRKPEIYSTALSKTPVDSSRCPPLGSRELSRAVFRSSRVAVGLFVHIVSSEDIMISHQKSSKIHCFMAPVLTNSPNSDPPEKTDWLLQKLNYYGGP